jgi:uncharacterized protein with HEPN domain
MRRNWLGRMRWGWGESSRTGGGVTCAEKAILSELLILARTVRAIVDARTGSKFIADDSTVTATMGHVIAMAELASRLDPATRAKHPEIPWAEISLTGSRYRELGPDMDRVSVWWKAQHHVDGLVVMLEAVLAKAPEA